MSDYSFTIPCFFMLVIILVFYFARPRLSVRFNRRFVTVTLLELLSLLFNILANRAVDAYPNTPDWLVHSLTQLYFSIYIQRSFDFFLLTIDTMHLKSGTHRLGAWASRGVMIAAEVIIVASLFTGWVYSLGPEGFQRGPLYFVLYASTLYFLYRSFYRLLRSARQMDRMRFLSALGANLLLLVGTFMRIILPRQFMMDTFSMLAIAVFYLTYLNPERYLSERGTAFNGQALREMLAEKLRTGRYSILGLSLRDYADERSIYGSNQMDQGVVMVIRFLQESFPDYPLFELHSGNFALLGTENTDWQPVRTMILNRFQQPWKADEADMFLNAAFVQMDESVGLDTPEDIYSSLLLAFEEAGQRRDEEDVLVDMGSFRQLQRRITCKRRLEWAVENDQVEVFLQPLAEAETGKVIAAEALARIRDEDGSIIPPGEFISIAERSGQINRLGEQVFEKVCRFIGEGSMARLGLGWINVNLSPIQCMTKDLSSRFSQILEKYGVSSESIHLEITEESMVDRSVMENQIQNLNRMGFQMVLDDYGSGYSNLSRLKRYPMSGIKLDMEVVQSFCREQDNILPALVQVFQTIGYSVTAEGVETPEMAAILRDIGCDYLQGYLFSRPLSLADFIRKYET